MTDTKVNSRLALFMKMKNVNASQLADNIQVQRSAISHILNGRNKPSIDFLMKLKAAYNELSIDWLLTGKQHGGTNVNSTQSNDSTATDTDVNTLGRTNSEKKHVKTDTIVNFTSNHTFQDSENEAQKKAPNKVLLKVMMFYSDGTFDSFTPNEQK